MNRTLAFSIATFVAISATTAMAADAPWNVPPPAAIESSGGTPISISAGVLDVGAAPQYAHVALYGIVGASVAIPAGPITIIPELAIEYTPQALNIVGASTWGGVLTCTADKAISGTPIGIDVTGVVLSDQIGTGFTNAALYGGAGAGATWFINDHWSASAAWNGYHGLNTAAPPGWTQGPIAFASYTF